MSEAERTSGAGCPATVLLTTQYPEEVDQLADRVAVLHNGRLVESGTPAELKRLVPGSRIDLRFHDRPAMASASPMFVDAGRYPTMTVGVLLPLIMLLLFEYVYGWREGTLVTPVPWAGGPRATIHEFSGM